MIDGQVAFTGGVNLADEYINRVVRFGHWKDTAVMLRGEAVRSFTLMFLNMWAIDEHTMESSRFLAYPTKPVMDAPGFVLPYSDSPVDGNKVGEQVYIDILSRARRYVHIMTPYLIIDHNMETALQYAAERGVDVHLILPGIPDKKYAFALAHTHYASLMKAGVKISEYTPASSTRKCSSRMTERPSSARLTSITAVCTTTLSARRTCWMCRASRTLRQIFSIH